MSKCIRGIPWYNDKVKSPVQQFAIDKVLNEEPEDRVFEQGTAAAALDIRQQAREALVYFPENKTLYHRPTPKVTTAEASKVTKISKKIDRLLGINKKGGKYKYQEHTKFQSPRATNEDRAAANKRKQLSFGTFDSKLNVNTLNTKTFPVILKWLESVNKISAKIKIPSIRSIRNTTTNQQRERPTNGGSMGDGSMNISSLYINKLFEAGTTLTEAQATRLEQIAERIKVLSNESAQIDKAYGYSDEHYIEMSELRDEHSKIAHFKKFNAEKAIADYLMFGEQPRNIIEYYNTAEQRAMAIMYHEFGHHIHQQYGVTSKEKLIAPDIEQLLVWWRTRHSVRHITKYSEVQGPKSILVEWFAENHAYWAMEKYEGIAPLGKSEKVLDPFFIFLMDTINKGIGTQPYGSRVLNKNGLRQQHVHEQIMQAVDKYLEDVVW